MEATWNTSDGVTYEVDEKFRFRVSALVEGTGVIRLRLDSYDGRYQFVQLTPDMAEHLADVLHDCANRAEPDKSKGKKKTGPAPKKEKVA